MSDTAYIHEAKPCDFDSSHGSAAYDFRTKFGPWANGCQACWVENRASDKLGTGHGQRLVVGEKPKNTNKLLAAVAAELGMSEDEVLMEADDLGMTDLFD